MGSRKQAHCVNGHPFDEANTYWRVRKAWGTRKAGTFRQCRTCHNMGTKFFDTFKRTSSKKGQKKGGHDFLQKEE